MPAATTASAPDAAREPAASARRRRLSLLLATTAASVLVLGGAAPAADYTVSTATTEQNGDSGTTLTDNDTLTIEESGSITLSGADPDGVHVDAASTELVNDGAIDVTGTGFARGFNVFTNTGDVGTIVNNGTIDATAGAQDGHGILSYNSGSGSVGAVTNSGTITVLSIDGKTFGIFTQLDPTTNGSIGPVTNLGTISATSTNNETFGILSQSLGGGVVGTVTNSGDIDVGGTVAFGIDTYTDSGLISGIVNDGTIEATATSGEADGILAKSNVSGSIGTITNTGVLDIDGDTAYGVQAFINSGTIDAVSSSGTITADGVGGAAGLHVTGGSVGAVGNSGTISATATAGAVDGVFAYAKTGNVDSATNSGSIDVMATGDAEGLYAKVDVGTVGLVDNSGSISAASTGANAFGIEAGSGGSGGVDAITNSGDITASGAAGYSVAIYARSSTGAVGDVTNSGTLDASGVYAYGIGVDAGSGTVGTLVNAGDITVSGTSTGAGIGVLNGSGAAILNTGTISASGANVYGIESDGTDAFVSNSGSIVASEAGTASIYVTGAGSTLDLTTSGYLGGQITTQSDTLVNVDSNAAHSILWTFDGTDFSNLAISGSVPVFVNSATKQIATYDPTNLSASLYALSERTDLISDLAVQRAGDERPWIAAFGSVSRIDGTSATLDHSLSLGGLAVGAGREIAPGFAASGMLGYVSGRSSADDGSRNTLDNRSDGLFAGLRGSYDMSALHIGLGVTGGVDFHDDERFVNDNTALTNGQTLGRSTASADYTSYWASPELDLGVTVAEAAGWTLTPTARFRYAFELIDDYSESGAAGAASIDSRQLGLGVAKLELVASRVTEGADFTARLGVRGTKSLGDDSADVTLIGSTLRIPDSYEDELAGYLGAEAGFSLGANARLGFSGTVLVGDAIESLGGNATFSLRF